MEFRYISLFTSECLRFSIIYISLEKQKGGSGGGDFSYIVFLELSKIPLEVMLRSQRKHRAWNYLGKVEDCNLLVGLASRIPPRDLGSTNSCPGFSWKRKTKLQSAGDLLGSHTSGYLEAAVPLLPSDQEPLLILMMWVCICSFMVYFHVCLGNNLNI